MSLDALLPMRRPAMWSIPALIGVEIGAIGLAAALAALPVNALTTALTTLAVIAVALALVALIAATIDAPLRAGRADLFWPYGLCLGFFAYAAIRMGSTSFAHHDEIYSWNMWAVQRFHGEAPDRTYTYAAYPQLFSCYLAAVYRAIGSIHSHALPRVFAAIPTFVFFLAIAIAGAIASRRAALLVGLLLCALFFGLNLNLELSVALADPLMCAALLASALLLIRFLDAPAEPGWLVGASLCAIVAAYTKQPALIWGCGGFAIVAIAGVATQRLPRWTLAAAAATTAICLVWPLWIAPGFTDNPGVMHASLRGRGYAEQLRHAATTYLLLKPHLALLLIAGGVAAWRRPMLRAIWLVTVLPMTLAWFLFGAYQLRLGLHVIGLSALLMVAALGGPVTALATSPAAMTRRPRRVATATAALLALIAAGVVAEAARKGNDLGDGARVTFRTQYGAGSEPVFDRLIAERARVWTTSNYAYGALYDRLPLGRPDYVKVASSPADIRRELLAFEADYAVATQALAFREHGPLLLQLGARCPAALIAVLAPPNPADFTLLRVDRAALARCDLSQRS